MRLAMTRAVSGVLGVRDPAGQLEPPAGAGRNRRRRHDVIGDAEEPARLRGVGQVQMAAADVDGEIDDLALLDRHRVGRLGRRGRLALLDDGSQPRRDRLTASPAIERLLRLLVEAEDAQPAVVDEPAQLFLLARQPEVGGGELFLVLETQALEVLVPGNFNHREQAGVAPGDLFQAPGGRPPDQASGQGRDEDLLGGDERPQLFGDLLIAFRRSRRVGVPDLEDHARVGSVALHWRDLRDSGRRPAPSAATTAASRPPRLAILAISSVPRRWLASSSPQVG